MVTPIVIGYSQSSFTERIRHILSLASMDIPQETLIVGFDYLEEKFVYLYGLQRHDEPLFYEKKYGAMQELYNDLCKDVYGTVPPPLQYETQTLLVMQVMRTFEDEIVEKLQNLQISIKQPKGEVQPSNWNLEIHGRVKGSNFPETISPQEARTLLENTRTRYNRARETRLKKDAANNFEGEESEIHQRKN